VKTVRAEFSKATKLAAFERANGHCETCRQKIITRAEYDHRIPCGLGGDNSLENCVCVCVKCHRVKTSTKDVPAISKAVRLKEKQAGARTKRGGFSKTWRKKMSGEVVRRGE